MNGVLQIDSNELNGVLEEADGDLLLVDFDETLWLRNSTEEFLSRARPAPMAAFVLRALAVCRPWRVVFGRRDGRHYRDWLRVGAVLVLMPWTYIAWRRAARNIGSKFVNERLENLIQKHRAGRVVIVSNGFRALIAPLTKGLRLKGVELIAAPLAYGGFWRARGKVRAAEDRLSASALDRAVFITDHENDADLLARVGTGVLCVWPDAVYKEAFASKHA